MRKVGGAVGLIKMVALIFSYRVINGLVAHGDRPVGDGESRFDGFVLSTVAAVLWL